MTELLAKSQLFLGRSGSTTIAEVTALGLPAVYVPSPNVTADQQTKNAQEYVDQGAAIIIKDEDLTGQTLVEAISNILENNEKYQEMQALGSKNILNIRKEKQKKPKKKRKQINLKRFIFLHLFLKVSQKLKKTLMTLETKLSQLSC